MLQRHGVGDVGTGAGETSDVGDAALSPATSRSAPPFDTKGESTSAGSTDSPTSDESPAAPLPTTSTAPTVLAVATAVCGRERCFSRGFGLLRSSGQGSVWATWAQKLHAALKEPDPAVSLALLEARCRGGSAPLRLLDAVLPGLQAELLKRLADLPVHLRRPLQHFMFDGLHLSLCGLGAALVAWHHTSDMVCAPLGCPVVLSPHAVLHTSAAGGGESPPRSTCDAASVLHTNRVPLAFVLERWPVLPAAFSSTPLKAVRRIEAFLHSIEEGAPPGNIPQPLVRLHWAYLESLSTPATTFTLSQGGEMLQCLLFNSAAVRLFGLEHWPMPNPAAPMLSSEGLLQPRLVHPDCLTRRCLAMVAAAVQGLSCFQLEGHYLRRVAPSTPPGAAMPCVPPAPPAASSFFATETSVRESIPGMGDVLRGSYFSDIHAMRQPLQYAALDFTGAQLSAIEELMLREPAVAPLEVQLATSRKQLHAHSLLHPTFIGVDPEIERVLLRQAMLIQAHDVPASPQPGGGGQQRSRASRIRAALTDPSMQADWQAVIASMKRALTFDGGATVPTVFCGNVGEVLPRPVAERVGTAGIRRPAVEDYFQQHAFSVEQAAVFPLNTVQSCIDP